MRSVKMIMTALILLTTILTGCAHVKPYYLPGSKQLTAADQGAGPCPAAPWPYVLQSKGDFIDITNVNPESGKCFKVVYEPCK